MRTRTLLLGVILLAACGVAGCGSSKQLPTTPIRGKVVFEKGGTVKKLYDAQPTILFESLEQPEVHASAAITEDGSLASVITRKQQAVEYGLLEGNYRVRLELDEQYRNLVHARFLTFEKSGLTVKVPSDGEMLIKVWR